MFGIEGEARSGSGGRPFALRGNAPYKFHRHAGCSDCSSVPKSTDPLLSSHRRMQIAGQGHVAAIIPVKARMRVMLRHGPCFHLQVASRRAFHAEVMQGHGWLIVKIANPRVRA